MTSLASEAGEVCRGCICLPGLLPAVFRARLVAYMVTCRDQNWLHILRRCRAADSTTFQSVLTYSVTEAATDASIGRLLRSAPCWRWTACTV
jgi:hypothetical protein